MREILSTSNYLGINTDSRSIKLGDIYLPLKGLKFDGHDFIGDALAKGASFAYSSLEPSELNLPIDLSSKVVKVDDTLSTYHKLANEYRNIVNPITIAITGSSGKTTVKEILKTVLVEKFKVHYSQANFNNEIGVPKTILSMPIDTEVLILEMGMRGLGEIELLSKTAEPNIAIITNIGTAHIERLGSVENIKRAKLEIVSGLKAYKFKAQGSTLNATLFVDSKLYAEIKNSYKDIDLISFDSVERSALSVQPHYLLSEGLIADINAVSKLAKLLGLNDDQINAGLSKYSPGEGRGKFIYDTVGNLYIDETYNANPESIRNSVKAMLTQFPDDMKIAVLGEVLESQEDLVNELFLEIKSYENESFKLIDGRGRQIDDIVKELNMVQTARKKVILVKASRGAKFEQILTLLKL